VKTYDFIITDFLLQTARIDGSGNDHQEKILEQSIVSCYNDQKLQTVAFSDAVSREEESHGKQEVAYNTNRGGLSDDSLQRFRTKG
jgi:hypothetical protein